MKHFSDRAAVITLDAKIAYLDKITDILKIDIRQATYRRLEDLKLTIDRLCDEGIGTVIGSSLVLP